MFNNKQILMFSVIAILTMLFPLSAFAAQCGGSVVGNIIFNSFLFLVSCALLISTFLSFAFPRLMIGINFILALLILILIPPSGFFNLDYTSPNCSADSFLLAFEVLVIYAWAVINIVITYRKITNIFSSISRGDMTLLKLKEEEGLNINIQDKKGWSLLHHAVFHDHKEIIEYLISKNANIEIRNNDGESPLHLVAMSGNIDIAKILISKGADINTKNINDVTPLHFAVHYDRKEMVAYLISQSANINAQTKLGSTPLDFNKDNEIKNLLISHGAKSGKELKELQKLKESKQESKEGLEEETK